MPIKGKFYTSKELQLLLKRTRPAIDNLSKRQKWIKPVRGLGLWEATQVEQYLRKVGHFIEPQEELTVEVIVKLWGEAVVEARVQQLPEPIIFARMIRNWLRGDCRND